MRILVLGGTGAMGVHLVQVLAELGHEVHVTSRSRGGKSGNIKYITGNAHDETFLNHLLSDRWDGIVDFMVYSTGVFKKRYQQLLKATAHYIYLSSSRVYADSDTPITEKSLRLLDVSQDEKYLATDEYALTKARQEDLLFNSKYQNWTIIRPYITYDTERLQLGVLEKEDWLYRAVHGRTIVTAKDIQTKQTTLTSGADVAKTMAALIGNKKAQGEAFHITTDESLTWSEVTAIYQNALKENNITAKVLEQNLNDFLDWRQGVYQVTYDRLYNRNFDNSKVKQFVDTSGFISPKVGLAQCLTDFLAIKPLTFKAPNWQEEALKDRLNQVTTPLSEISGAKQKIKYCLFNALPAVGRLITR